MQGRHLGKEGWGSTDPLRICDFIFFPLASSA